MEKRFSWGVIPLVLGLFLLTGCRSRPYQHDALCSDRDVPFCEDFEEQTQKVQYLSLSGAEWYVDGDDSLIKWDSDLPIEGRSSQFLASVGLLLGEYDDNTKTLLFTPTIDLSEVNSPFLYYNLMYLTEKHWDGMVVIASVDQGKSWGILEPEGGYPSTIRLGSQIISGYSGFQPFWSHERIDLSFLVGNEVMVGFYFLSDSSIQNHGVALDDIVLDGDGRVLVSQTPGNYRTAELKINLPKDPLLSVDIPGAIAINDTPCEGGEVETLKESSRAFIKAINQTGDRYQVLHPESGNFCWVWFEDVWIDNQGELPTLSDLKPEDYYLPFCSLSKSPIISSPGCAEEFAGSDYSDKLLYHLTTALVEYGKITTLVIDPGPESDEGELEEPVDLRTGDQADLEQISPEGIRRGDFKVVINGNLELCSFDTLHPGRVICQNTLIDAAGPLQADICWQGWDNTQFCPPGFGLLPGISGCVIPVEDKSCTPECPPGYQYNTDHESCLINQDTSGLNLPNELCPDGYRENVDAACCVMLDPGDLETCPEGFYFLPEKESCYKLADGSDCPDGLAPQEGTGACLPEAGKPLPICTSFEVQFPEPEVTVKQSTICRKGPGKDFETVSSLSPFSVVTVLGTGMDGEYLVVYNASYQAPCWALRDDFYWDKLDLSILPIFSVTSVEN